MKFFHLGDLHLGRSLHKHSLIEDQKFYLNFILEKIDQFNPEAVVIAGDVYDRTIPSAEATEVFDYFLTELSQRACSTMIIAGNHDSAARLSFASSVYKKFNIHISTEYRGKIERVIFDLDQVYYFHLLPFFKPAQIRRFHPDRDIQTYGEALSVMLESIDLTLPGKHILVSHQFFTNRTGEAIVSDSEQISVGGLDHISAELIADFDYVALGHLHQPQYVQYKNIRYSGSPIVYSASELARPKFLSLIEFDDQSKLHIHEIDFEPLHPVRLIEGKFRDLIYQAKETPSEDYVYLSVLDEEPITDLAARFRYFYPRLLEVRTPHFEYSASNYRSLSESPGNLSISQLFEQFHFEETGKNITDEDQALIQKLEQKLRHS